MNLRRLQSTIELPVNVPYMSKSCISGLRVELAPMRCPSFVANSESLEVTPLFVIAKPDGGEAFGATLLAEIHKDSIQLDISNST